MRDDDAFDLQRFVTAQDEGSTYDRALSELRRGRKVSHWMWFVLPQVAGLGTSPMAQRYALSSLVEATAYVAHPVLGPRLLQCATALNDLTGTDPVRVLGLVDGVKLRSSMTLFERAAPEQPVFAQVLAQYFEGERDARTLALL